MDAKERESGTEILGRLEGRAVAAIPVLRQALTRADSSLRDLIAKTLQRIEAGAENRAP